MLFSTCYTKSKIVLNCSRVGRVELRRSDLHVREPWYPAFESREGWGSHSCKMSAADDESWASPPHSRGHKRTSRNERSRVQNRIVTRSGGRNASSHCTAASCFHRAATSRPRPQSSGSPICYRQRARHMQALHANCQGRWANDPSRGVRFGLFDPSISVGQSRQV